MLLTRLEDRMLVHPVFLPQKLSLARSGSRELCSDYLTDQGAGSINKQVTLMDARVLGIILILNLPAAFLPAQSSSRDIRMEGRVPQTSQVKSTRIDELLTVLEQPIDPSEYVVGPGDIFVVSINDVVPYLDLVVVTPTGEMIIPAVGGVAVGGLTLLAANRSVLERIRKMYPALEAYCTLYDLRKIRVGISGAIYKAGYYLATPVSRVSDLITMAGDPLISAALDQVVIERLDGEHIVYDMTRYYYAGDISQNPTLRGGDRVILPFTQAGSNGNNGMRQVIVIGEVKKPGSFIYQPGLKVIDYVAMAGGPTTYSSLSSIQVLRNDGQEAEGPRAEIMAGDIVHVRRSLRYILVGNTGYMQGILVGLNMYLAFLATRR